MRDILWLAKTYGVERNLFRQTGAFSAAASFDKKKQLLAMPIGCKKPVRESMLGGALRSYIYPKNKCYDPCFDKAIRGKQPQWFVTITSENKRKLLAIPIGDKCPNKKTSYGPALRRYSCKKYNCYDPEFDRVIRKRQPHWFVTVIDKKQRLLAMPKGCKRPLINKHPLGTPLFCYTSKKTSSYDPEFDTAIRKRQPRWFIDTVAENKKALLAMPKGCKRPNYGYSLGSSLFRYARSKDASYDPIFDKAIRKRHPQWFINTATENKKKLLAFARGDTRPKCKKNPLGLPLCRYTNINLSTTYDAEFDMLIRKKQPHWFVGQQEESLKKKRLLLNMRTDMRPSYYSPIGRALCRYINKNGSCYDLNFDKAIRKKNPMWFANMAMEKKKQLLAMQKGCARPTRKHPLGGPLCRYVHSNDPEFDKAIRKKHPQWFIDIVAESKKKLLAMHTGIERPIPKRHPLGSRLSEYTRKKRHCYDPEFDRAIRKKQPKWF